MKIVQTANDGRDYPDEKLVDLGPLQKEVALKFADIFNETLSGNDPQHYPRYWKVVEDDYVLSRGMAELHESPGETAAREAVAVLLRVPLSDFVSWAKEHTERFNELVKLVAARWANTPALDRDSP